MVNLNEYEINSLRFQLEHYFSSLKNDDSTLLNFLANPLEKLKEKNIRIIEKISSSYTAPLKDFIRKLILDLKNKFSDWDKCAACKIGLKIIYYAFASAYGIKLGLIVNHEEFKLFTSEFIGRPIVDIFDNPIIQDLISELENFSLSILINKLCEIFGFCTNYV